MADLSHKSVMESRARTIGKKLKHLWKKFADREQRKSIAIDEIVFIMEYMAIQFGTDHGHLFQNHFIEHLELYSKLTSDGNQTEKFADSFQKLTKILCETITKDGFRQNYLRRLLTIWLSCLEHAPCGAEKVDTNLMQNCGRFLIDAKCYSMQMRMLNIICIYLRREQDFTMSINPFAFIAKFDGVVNVTEDVMKTLIGIFNKTTTLTLIEKHRILDLLNNCSKKRSIFSMPIKSLNLMDISGTHVHLEDNSGWMHLNIRSGIVEFWLITNDELKKLYITPHKLKKIDLIELTKTSSLVVMFERKSSSPQQHVSNIVATLDTKCDKSKLIVLLRRTFPEIDVKIKQDETTFCSTLKRTHMDDESATNFVQCALTQSSLSSCSDAEEVKKSTLRKDSTFYGTSSDDDIQNCIVSTTRKRSPLEDVQSLKSSINNLDASTAKRRLRTDEHQFGNGTANAKEVSKIQNFNTIDSKDKKKVESELEYIIKTAKHALTLVQTIQHT